MRQGDLSAPAGAQPANKSNVQTKVMLTPFDCGRDTHNMEPDRSGAVATPTIPAASAERREKRLHVAVPVKLFLAGDNANFQLCCTYEVSLIGARLVAVSGIAKVGQVVWLQRHSRRAKYKVVWIGIEGTEQANQAGVELLEPGNVIWETELRSRISQK